MCMQDFTKSVGKGLLSYSPFITVKNTFVYDTECTVCISIIV